MLSMAAVVHCLCRAMWDRLRKCAALSICMFCAALEKEQGGGVPCLIGMAGVVKSSGYLKQHNQSCGETEISTTCLVLQEETANSHLMYTPVGSIPWFNSELVLAKPLFSSKRSAKAATSLN